MLRSMGWREGRGIGLANVKQKQHRGALTESALKDIKSENFNKIILGGISSEAQFDREQAAKVAPMYEFANENAIVKQLTPLSGSHGIGYQVAQFLQKYVQ